MSTKTLKLKVRYDDRATRIYSLEDMYDAGFENAKTKIKTFNTELANPSGEKYAAYRETFVNYDSETGTTSPIAVIASANIIETTEEIVYNG